MKTEENFRADFSAELLWLAILGQVAKGRSAKIQKVNQIILPRFPETFECMKNQCICSTDTYPGVSVIIRQSLTRVCLLSLNALYALQCHGTSKTLNVWIKWKSCGLLLIFISITYIKEIRGFMKCYDKFYQSSIFGTCLVSSQDRNFFCREDVQFCLLIS